MADPTDKLPGQAAGRFFVDSQCIDCDLCRSTAPENFLRNEEDGYSYVSRQPDNADQEFVVRDALKNCPVDAIGEDLAENDSARAAPDAGLRKTQ
ncbi:MAG: ferredoxin [Acidobacteriota bacterium]